ncbi:flagellar biosynthesis protein FliR [Gracilibacillus halophilus YIM-C55.5]|uniref:Flagellar biosynthetic protein FliR n=1 Tax=Gracilibacillus halophilus YIM-C55.5 TaxID=1308866 RepID=N4WG14_9BACI|nr:flagellar biosynthetic protein FliR [Gracilibacillus halophilus]ENH98224.1 flagellar biosynthesis protein FliR [Gracilibacillus halophilus YIM-C55.5]
MIDWININSFPAFILILARVISFFATVPIFSYRSMPNQLKIGIAFFLAWITFYSIETPTVGLNGEFVILIMKEVVIGLLLGLIAYIILTAIQIAGGFIDFQMGFAIANVVDPQTGAQSPLIGQYFYTIAMLFILSVDGHHLFINGLFFSFQELPLDELIHLENVEFIIVTFSEMFMMAFQLAIPIVGCLFLVDVALGIIARTVPQLNVFVVGLPLKIFVTFVVLFMFIAFYIMAVKQLFHFTLETMQELIRIFGGA